MKHQTILVGALLITSTWGCGSDTTTTPPADSGTDSAWDASGSAGSAGTGGSAGSAGADAFWDSNYDPLGSPSPSGGAHHAGEDCMSCHSSKDFLFGGNVYGSDKTSGVAHVQVGVKSGGVLYTAYSGKNGTFHATQGSKSFNWLTAEIRMRNASGERKMTSQGAEGCSSCHTQTSQTLVAP